MNRVRMQSVSDWQDADSHRWSPLCDHEHSCSPSPPHPDSQADRALTWPSMCPAVSPDSDIWPPGGKHSGFSHMAVCVGALCPSSLMQRVVLCKILQYYFHKIHLLSCWSATHLCVVCTNKVSLTTYIYNIMSHFQPFGLSWPKV